MYLQIDYIFAYIYHFSMYSANIFNFLCFYSRKLCTNAWIFFDSIFYSILLGFLLNPSIHFYFIFFILFTLKWTFCLHLWSIFYILQSISFLCKFLSLSFEHFFNFHLLFAPFFTRLWKITAFSIILYTSHGTIFIIYSFPTML